MNFSIKLAQQLIESNDRFPVSFDLAWEWIGYSRKDSAKRALLEAGFIENEDLHINVEPTTTGISGIRGGDVNENISLTIECFKMWAMMSKTSQGRQVREYFIECERIAKQSIAPEPKPLQLPPSDVRLANLAKALKFLDIDTENPRFKQGLQDLTLDILGTGKDALKPENNEVWCGVTERAEQLGYAIILVLKHNIKLGNAIAKLGLKSKKEDRLCNGTQRPINLYRVCDELDDAIFTYFYGVNKQT